MIKMNVEYMRLLGALIIFLISMTIGALTVWWGKVPGKKSLSYANAFSGGILLGTALLHLLPESIGQWKLFYPHSSFPTIELLVAGGILLILFVERVLVGCDHHALHEVAQEKEGRVAYVFALTIAMSMHAFIAGMALGAQDSVDKMSILLIAVLAHKGAETFAIAIAMTYSHLKKITIWAIILLFSVMTPLGIITGGIIYLLLEHYAHIIGSVFNAISAGTFIYIATIDVIIEEFKLRGGFVKFILLALGVVIMAFISFYMHQAGHSHN